MTKLAERYRIGSHIDTFALGHYARVFEAHDQQDGQTVAFKVLRQEHLANDGEIRWEFRAFANEVDLLLRLSNSPHIVDLVDCGYIEASADVPRGGEVAAFGRDVDGFSRALPDYAEAGWRPYLSMPMLPRSQNLYYLMKPGQQGLRRRLPTEEGLALAIQFAHTLSLAHEQGIVYLDHKLEHIYWDGSKLRVIDLNSSRRVKDDERASAFRTDLHNLCVGVLYPIFTGLSPYRSSLRPQPGNQAQAEGRYNDVTTLDFGAEPNLSAGLQDLLQRGAAMELEQIDALLDGLQEVASLLGWDFPGRNTTGTSRSARDHMREGLRHLREGQAHIREARDYFRDAAILDDIPEDLEVELRRLVKAANDMLNHRAIP